MDRIIDMSELADQLDVALAEVRAGGTITITSEGSPLAKLVPSPEPPPVDDELAREQRVRAVERMIDEARKRGPMPITPWTRDELYERAPWPDGPPCP